MKKYCTLNSYRAFLVIRKADFEAFVNILYPADIWSIHMADFKVRFHNPIQFIQESSCSNHLNYNYKIRMFLFLGSAMDWRIFLWLTKQAHYRPAEIASDCKIALQNRACKLAYIHWHHTQSLRFFYTLSNFGLR